MFSCAVSRTRVLSGIANLTTLATSCFAECDLRRGNRAFVVSFHKLRVINASIEWVDRKLKYFYVTEFLRPRRRKKYVKHASGLHAKKEEQSGRPVGRSIGSVCSRQEISDTVFADTRNASLVTTIDARQEHEFSSDFSRRGSATSYTRGHRDTTVGRMLASRWNAGNLQCNKILVKPSHRSVTAARVVNPTTSRNSIARNLSV